MMEGDGMDNATAELEYDFADDENEYVMISHDSENEDGSYSTKNFKNERNSWTSPNSRTQSFMSSANHTGDQSTAQFITASSLIPDDECDIFGKHVAVELRHINDDFVKQITKMKISTILHEARLTLLGRQNPTQQHSVQQNRQNNHEVMQPYIVVDQPPVSASQAQM